MGDALLSKLKGLKLGASGYISGNFDWSIGHQSKLGVTLPKAKCQEATLPHVCLLHKYVQITVLTYFAISKQ